MLCGDSLIDTFNPFYRIPKTIILKNANTFEKLLPLQDKFTGINRGTICAVVDYYI